MNEAGAPPSVSSTSLPGLLSFHVGQRATGTLVARAVGGERRIILVKGEIRAARSSYEDEMIGNWLMHRSHITENDRAQALFAQGRGDSPPLGFILVSRGILSRETLEAELQEQALTIIRRATEDPEAEVEFSEEKRADELDTLAQLTTTQILLTAARAFSDLGEKRRTLGDPGNHVSPAPDLMAQTADLALSPTEAFLLSRLEASRSMTSLFQVSSLPEDQAVSTVYALLIASLVTVGPPLERSAPVRKIERSPESEPAPLAVNEEGLSSAQLEERRTVRRLAEKATTANHYEALDMSPSDPPVRIPGAWKQIRENFADERVSEYHLSDLGPLLKIVRERAEDAYQVLGKTTSRHRYDQVLQQIAEDEKKLKGEGSVGETDPEARTVMVQANLQRANELIREGEIHLAIQLLEQACAFDPRPAELVKLAKLMVRNPMWDNRALKHLQRAIQADKKYIDAWIETAEYWRRHRDTERQRKALEKALAIDPENQRATRMYGQLAGEGPLKRVLKLARLTKR